MAISDDQVRAIARLARIEISDRDIPSFSTQLSQILEFVAQMDAIDTHDVEPLAHPLDLEARCRADEVLESEIRDVYQSVAPQVEDGLYLVPKVID
ncbi:MAG TPA: Asp-tRNA(Asn)/Glu-tRNA(Gln) amidotransferase subunit GatC [Gammaproteobacteria bacterium]|nr:Asp-tRNA(Asn)/Glu-tRNA(Gln) amidotransferase subunit GatC [Gammaproteobacteria bacterium]